MDIIITARRAGKTSNLIVRSNQSGAYIVCFNQDECARIAEQAKEMNLTIPFPITYNEFLKGQYYARGIKGFLIDNVDALLQQQTTVNIEAITLTGNCIEL